MIRMQMAKKVWRYRGDERVYTDCPSRIGDVNVWAFCMTCIDRELCFGDERFEDISKRAEVKENDAKS